MKRNNSRVGAAGILGALIAVGAGSYASALGIRDDVAPPKHHVPIEYSQLPDYDRQNVEISGIPLSSNYTQTRLADRNLEIVLQTDDGSPLNVESHILPASLTNVRNARNISYEVAKKVNELLTAQISSGRVNPITLRGRYIPEENIFRLHGVVIGNKFYDLFKPNSV